MTTTWQRIYSYLKQCNYDVYAPAQHKGDCKSKYIVIKDTGAATFGNYSSTSTTYDVMCYIPSNQFSQLESYIDSVRESMKELEKLIAIRATDFETASFYDDSINGHMVSMQYIVYKQKKE